MKKKLIEVALPLEAINKESAREKPIRHGHPSTLHLWWARRPLAACRAVLFASLVDDPSSLPEQFPTEADQDKERQRLFRLIEELVKWDNSNNPTILKAAHDEILKSTNGHPPPIYDPFCGGGSIPLEAQRLGLEAHGSDLNPVAVLITKALIEIPPKFAGQPPINPVARSKMSGRGMWIGSRGLADDVRYYGRWIRERAFERIGHLYPKVTLPEAHGGGTASVIAWLWARTVLCPNPACGARMPLVRSLVLSTKPGRKIWVEPIPDHVTKSVRFEVRSGDGAPEGTKQRNSSRCLLCGNVLSDAAVREQAVTHGFGQVLLAVAAEGPRGRAYLSANTCPQPDVPNIDTPWLEQPIAKNPRWFSPPGYGLLLFRDLFTQRQLVALTAFSDLVSEAGQQAMDDGASKDRAYAISTYLAFALDRSVDRGSTICSWDSSPKMEALRNTFARQAIQMTWDFAEGSPFSESSGNWMNNVEWVSKTVDGLLGEAIATASQLDATALSRPAMYSTDPPYYDNIGYSDLSDFFFVWLRRSLGAIYPDECGTLLVPKRQELIATPYRFEGSKERAQKFFEDGFGKVFEKIREVHNSEYPLTVYYAFKQSESKEDDDERGIASQASTGWETMLEGLLQAGFQSQAHGRCEVKCRIAPSLAALTLLPPQSSSFAALDPIRQLSRPERTFSLPSRKNSRRPFVIFKRVTLPPSTWLKQPSAPAWRSFRDSRRC
jgi:putative DNA methylase